MRVGGKRRSGRRHQCIKGGTRPASLWRYFARWGVGPGTRRSDYSRASFARSAVGIAVLQGGEDVKINVFKDNAQQVNITTPAEALNAMKRILGKKGST